jgi:hypothetical protein
MTVIRLGGASEAHERREVRNMRKTTLMLCALVLALIAVAVPVYADGHGHFRGSIWIGPGWGLWGPWYPYSYYAYPPVVVERQAPAYEQTLPQQEQPFYWYYCKEAKAYYPYVKHCPGGWQKVAPQPPPPPKGEE